MYKINSEIPAVGSKSVFKTLLNNLASDFKFTQFATFNYRDF